MTGIGYQSLANTFSQAADRTLLVLADGREITYAAFWDAAAARAHRLIELGLTPGDRILVRAENSPALLELYLACALAGVAACPVDPAIVPARLAPVEAILKPKLVVDTATLDLIGQAPTKTGTLPTADGSRDFLIIFSSGTTGEPKGIVHTVDSMVGSAASFAQLAEMGQESVVYHHFPMFYMAGIFNLFFCPMMAGSRIVVGPRFSAAEMLRFWTLPKKFGVNHLTLTPTMALSLSHVYRKDDELLDSLARYQAVISTSSALHDSIATRFNDTFGVPLRSCYGVTEVGGSITLEPWADALANASVGRFQPTTEIRAGAGPDQPAEILVRTSFMSKGYVTKDGLVSPVDAQGFFHTGDTGYVQDGALFVTGRDSDLVKRGGEFVSLVLIENVALKCDRVTDVAAVAVPDDYWGSRLVVFYVPATGADVFAIDGDLQALLKAELREIERPDKLIAIPQMPKTSIGKTIKRDLVQRYTI